jgi:hypothetical protein
VFTTAAIGAPGRIASLDTAAAHNARASHVEETGVIITIPVVGWIAPR